MTTGRKVDLWFWRPEGTVGEIERWRRHLSVEELDRISRFMFAKDKTRFTVCRSRMRRILGWYLGISPGDVEFGFTGRNKPVLVSDTSGLSFNLSHTDGLACLAVTYRSRIGIDLECIREIKGDFIAYALNPAEHADVARLARNERPVAFLRYWTAKEAYLKAIGTGLWQSLKSFDVWVPIASRVGEMSVCTLPRIDDPIERTRNWKLYTFQASNRHLGALAVARESDEHVEIACRWIGGAAPK